MRIFRCNFAKFSQGHASGPPRMVVPSAVPWLLRPIHLRPFIWDHVHLKPRHLRPRSFETYSFETTSFETTVIWDHSHLRPVNLRPRSHETFSFETTFIWDRIHLRPHSFETTVIWDHIHLRPQSFETTLIWHHFIWDHFIWDHFMWDHFIWDHIYLRPHSFETTSFETTFIWDHIHFRSHSFYAMLKWSCFDLLCITFYDLPFTSLRETWSFASWQFIWSFARLRPSVCRGDSRWFPNAPALRVGSRGGNGDNWPGPLSPRGPRDDNHFLKIKYSFEKLWIGSDTWIQICDLMLQWVGLHLLISLQFSHAASFSNHYWM